jgi:hypothetical protein
MLKSHETLDNLIISCGSGSGPKDALEFLMKANILDSEDLPFFIKCCVVATGVPSHIMSAEGIFDFSGMSDLEDFMLLNCQIKGSRKDVDHVFNMSLMRMTGYLLTANLTKDKALHRIMTRHGNPFTDYVGKAGESQRILGETCNAYYDEYAEIEADVAYFIQLAKLDIVYVKQDKSKPSIDKIARKDVVENFNKSVKSFKSSFKSRAKRATTFISK